MLGPRIQKHIDAMCVAIPDVMARVAESQFGDVHFYFELPRPRRDVYDSIGTNAVPDAPPPCGCLIGSEMIALYYIREEAKRVWDAEAKVIPELRQSPPELYAEMLHACGIESHADGVWLSCVAVDVATAERRADQFMSPISRQNQIEAAIKDAIRLSLTIGPQATP